MKGIHSDQRPASESVLLANTSEYEYEYRSLCESSDRRTEQVWGDSTNDDRRSAPAL